MSIQWNVVSLVFIALSVNFFEIVASRSSLDKLSQKRAVFSEITPFWNLQPKNLYAKKYHFKQELWSGEGQLCGQKTCLYQGWFPFKKRFWLIKKCRNSEEAANELFVSRFGIKNGIPVQMTFPELKPKDGGVQRSGLCIQMLMPEYIPLARLLKHDNGMYHYYFGESAWKERVFEGIMYWFDTYQTRDHRPIDEYCLLKIIGMQLFLGCLDCHANNIFINPSTRMLVKIDNSLIGEPRARRLSYTERFCPPSEKRIMTVLTVRQRERFKFLKSFLCKLKRDNSTEFLGSLYTDCFSRLSVKRPIDTSRGLDFILKATFHVDDIIHAIEKIL